MKNKNICKFISPSLPDTLSVSCFVLESKPEVMKEKNILNEHRTLLVIQGSGYFNIDDARIPISAGSLVFAFKGECFCAECTDSLQYMYISFSGSRAESLFKRFDIKKNSRVFSGFDGMIPLWKESLSRASVQNVDLASESILLYTFSRIFGDFTERNSIVNKIVEISEENFTDPDLSITSIAETLAYSSKYLSHIFKEKTGTTYSEYLRSLRIKFAVSLFDHGIDSVKNVAILSGFSDPMYFSAVFKKNIGVSPKDYKKRSDEK